MTRPQSPCLPPMWWDLHGLLLLRLPYDQKVSEKSLANQAQEIKIPMQKVPKKVRVYTDIIVGFTE